VGVTGGAESLFAAVSGFFVVVLLNHNTITHKFRGVGPLCRWKRGPRERKNKTNTRAPPTHPHKNPPQHPNKPTPHQKP